jgi:hypothetical protein
MSKNKLIHTNKMYEIYLKFKNNLIAEEDKNNKNIYIRSIAEAVKLI